MNSNNGTKCILRKDLKADKFPNPEIQKTRNEKGMCLSLHLLTTNHLVFLKKGPKYIIYLLKYQYVKTIVSTKLTYCGKFIHMKTLALKHFLY